MSGEQDHIFLDCMLLQSIQISGTVFIYLNTSHLKIITYALLFSFYSGTHTYENIHKLISQIYDTEVFYSFSAGSLIIAKLFLKY